MTGQLATVLFDCLSVTMGASVRLASGVTPRVQRNIMYPSEAFQGDSRDRAAEFETFCADGCQIVGVRTDGTRTSNAQ